MSFLHWLNDNLNLLRNPYLNGMVKYKPKLPEHLLIEKPASIDDLKFVFSQIEKRVKETADDGDKINTKSLTIISICLTFLTALIGFIISKIPDADGGVVPLIVTSAYVIVELVIVIVSLKPNIYPTEYRSIGSKPSDLLISSMFQADDVDKKKTPEWRMIYSEILSFEERFMLNEHHNNQRNIRLKRAYDTLYRIPLFATICWVMMLLFLFCFGVI